MKKKAFILSLIIILTMITSTVFADRDLMVRIDSTDVEFNEETARPFIDENKRTLVPFRAALEAYGADIEWDEAAWTAKATKGDIQVEIPIGENYIIKNGEIIESDTISILKDGRTYLPIRKVMEAFGSQVHWDSKLSTVVINTEPVDAKERILAAYEKFYTWENYDMLALMNMTMDIADEAGNMQAMNMQMDMKATSFTNPMKMKVEASMLMDLGLEKIEQPFMEIYMTTEENKLTQYIARLDPISGEMIWVKQEVEDEDFIKLLDPNNEDMKAINEQSMTEVKYLGNYLEDEVNLEKYEVVFSYDAIAELMGGSLLGLEDILGEKAQISLDLVRNLGHMSYNLYLDETSGEFVRQEVDLTPIIGTVMEQMITMIGEEAPEGVRTEELPTQLPDQLLEMLKGIKIDMIAEYKNVNTASDFVIPEEALNAPTMEEVLEEL